VREKDTVVSGNCKLVMLYPKGNYTYKLQIVGKGSYTLRTTKKFGNCWSKYKVWCLSLSSDVHICSCFSTTFFAWEIW